MQTTLAKYKRNINKKVKKLYKMYFEIKLGCQDKWRAPQI